MQVFARGRVAQDNLLTLILVQHVQKDWITANRFLVDAILVDKLLLGAGCTKILVNLNFGASERLDDSIPISCRFVDHIPTCMSTSLLGGGCEGEIRET